MQGNSHQDTDLQLARAVRGLEVELQPQRDLWLGIERRIDQSPQPRPRSSGHWLPYGVAASLLIAVASLMLNLFAPVGPDPKTSQEPVGVAATLDQLSADHASRRAPMLATFQAVNASLDHNTRVELYRNIEIMDRARREIEAEVREHPQDRELVSALLRIQQRELWFLNQDYSYFGRTL